MLKMSVREHEEENTFENIFGAHNSQSIKSKIPKYRSLGTFKHRLFHSSSDVDVTKHGYDIVYSLIEKKNRFLRQWASKNNTIQKKNLTGDLIKLQKQISKATTDLCIEVPKYITKLVASIDEDPEENFFGKYNWLYTGGLIQHFYFHDKHYLAYVEGNTKDRLHVAPLKWDDQLWCIDKSGVQNVIPSPGKGIFQVLCVDKPNNNFIGVRQSDSCVIYNFSESGRISKCFSLLEIPLISFDISPVHEELCLMAMNHRVSFWDMNREKLPLTTYFPSDNSRFNNWHNLMYSADPSVISLAGRKSLKWMERRSSNVTNSVQLASLKGSQKDEEISMHFASKCNPSLMYVSTDINLFLLDIRSLSSVIQCWNHNLPTSPPYNCVIPYDTEEIVCIGNQYPGDIVLAFNSKSETCPPIKIPSRLESLFSHQASGLYLDPSIMPRMSVSLTGMTYLKSDKTSDIELLTHTAASDIFSQSLIDQNSLDKSDRLNGLVPNKEILHESARWNFKALYHELSKSDIQANPPVNRRRTERQPWQLSKQELLEYKDALAPLILEAWEFDKVNGKSGISSEQKVSAWLDSSFNTVYTSQGNNLWEDE